MILQGYFRILNFFDIAEAIELEKLRALLGPEAGPLTAAFRHRTPEYSQVQQAPIVESVGSITLLTNEKLDARIKYYWFGVAAVELTAVFECDLDALCVRSSRWMNAPEVEEAAEKLLREHLDRFGPALVRPSPKWLDEDYLIIDVESAKHWDGHSATAAELLDSYADQIAKLPVSRMLDTGRYPDQRISLVDAARDPVTCAHWSKPAGATTNSLTLLTGSALPIPDAVHTEDLVGAGNGGTASRIAMAPGTGYFAATVGENAASPAAGSLFWISDTGVRYGIDTEGGTIGPAKTAEVLGLSPPPTPIPWSMLSLFAPGPTLSRADALLAHDGLAPDSRPGRTAAQGENR